VPFTFETCLRLISLDRGDRAHKRATPTFAPPNIPAYATRGQNGPCSLIRRPIKAGSAPDGSCVSGRQPCAMRPGQSRIGAAEAAGYPCALTTATRMSTRPRKTAHSAARSGRKPGRSCRRSVGRATGRLRSAPWPRMVTVLRPPSAARGAAGAPLGAGAGVGAAARGAGAAATGLGGDDGLATRVEVLPPPPCARSLIAGRLRSAAGALPSVAGALPLVAGVAARTFPLVVRATGRFAGCTSYAVGNRNASRSSSSHHGATCRRRARAGIPAWGMSSTSFSCLRG